MATDICWNNILGNGSIVGKYVGTLTVELDGQYVQYVVGHYVQQQNGQYVQHVVGHYVQQQNGTYSSTDSEQSDIYM